MRLPNRVDSKAGQLGGHSKRNQKAEDHRYAARQPLAQTDDGHETMPEEKAALSKSENGFFARLMKDDSAHCNQRRGGLGTAGDFASCRHGSRELGDGSSAPFVHGFRLQHKLPARRGVLSEDWSVRSIERVRRIPKKYRMPRKERQAAVSQIPRRASKSC